VIEWWIIIGLPFLIIALLTNAWQIHKWHKFQRELAPNLNARTVEILELKANIDRLLPLFDAVLVRLQAQQMPEKPPEKNIPHLRVVDKSE